MRCDTTFRTLTLFLALFLFLAGTVHSYSVSRIIPSGKIEVYQDGKLVQELREEAPLPIGAILKTDGNCGLRVMNLYMIIENGSVFSVKDHSVANNIEIEKGMLFFAVSQSTRKIIFNTPSGAFETQQIMIQASKSSKLIKGFVEVSDKITRMGILEGGAVVVSTDQGTKTIASGNQIVLAQAVIIKPEEPEKQEPEKREEKETSQQGKSSDVEFFDIIPKPVVIVGGAVIGMAGLIALTSTLGGQSSSSPVSPSTP